MIKRNLYCPSCGYRTMHTYIGTQRGLPNGDHPQWDCSRCNTTNSGPDPRQDTRTEFDQLRDELRDGQR